MTNANSAPHQKSASLPLIAVLAVFTIQASAQQITKFDAPNSGTAPFSGTESLSINLFGTIAGDVTDNNGATHGFVRTPNGQFTEFDAPGASQTGATPCLEGGVGTCPIVINDLGVVTGFYGDLNVVIHGFLRGPLGKIETFDVAGAGSSVAQGTYAETLNDTGMVAGFIWDSNYLGHGFLRTPDGKSVTFDVPAAGTDSFEGTYPQSINNLGSIVGYYTDSNFAKHGFIRTPNGTLTTFDAPNWECPSAVTKAPVVNELRRHCR